MLPFAELVDFAGMGRLGPVDDGDSFRFRSGTATTSAICSNDTGVETTRADLSARSCVRILDRTMSAVNLATS